MAISRTQFMRMLDDRREPPQFAEEVDRVIAAIRERRFPERRTRIHKRGSWLSANSPAELTRLHQAYATDV